MVWIDNYKFPARLFMSKDQKANQDKIILKVVSAETDGFVGLCGFAGGSIGSVPSLPAEVVHIYHYCR